MARCPLRREFVSTIVRSVGVWRARHHGVAHTSPDPWEIPASSPGFADILARALAKYRGDRYNNALEMLEDVQAWLIDPHMRLLTVEPI